MTRDIRLVAKRDNIAIIEETRFSNFETTLMKLFPFWANELRVESRGKKKKMENEVWKLMGSCEKKIAKIKIVIFLH